MKSNINSFILISIILHASYELVSLKIVKKIKITNFDLWASEWFEKHKNYLTSMTDQKIKFRFPGKKKPRFSHTLREITA